MSHERRDDKKRANVSHQFSVDALSWAKRGHTNLLVTYMSTFRL